MSRNALGKGLSALIREPEPAPSATPSAVSAITPDAAREMVQLVDIDLIDPSPHQPRTRFSDAALEELTNSIRASGIIQPLLLRRRGSRFELIAGERRWRAAQRASLLRVPAIMKDVPDEVALEFTLIENLQREDLNPIEQAAAFNRLVADFAMTQEEVAARTGKDRATVANALRLLKLEKPIQLLLEEGKISAGHGRALLSVQDLQTRMTLARRAAQGGITVRQIERAASRRVSSPPSPASPSLLDPNTRAAIDDLQRHLGTRVHLKPRTANEPGRLIIEYYDDSQLHVLYERLTKN
jgi:ParB family transcriptional regulator, chromosome partitioning protein